MSGPVYVSPEDVERKFFSMGVIVSILSSLHLLTLILPWYQVDLGPFQEPRYLLGYLTTESLLFSLVGGILAGLGLLVSTFMSTLRGIRLALSTLALVGGGIMLISPFYLLMVKIPALEIKGKLEWGFFPSVITPLVLIAISIFIFKMRFEGEERTERIREEPGYIPTTYGGYPPYGIEQESILAPPSEEPTPTIPRETEEASLVPADEIVEGTRCVVCYYEVEPELAVKCSSCGMVFHRDCAESYISFNGVCPNPNCQKPIRG